MLKLSDPPVISVKGKSGASYDEALYPCPMCKNHYPRPRQLIGVGWRIRCTNRECSYGGPRKPTLAEAVEYYNRVCLQTANRARKKEQAKRK